MEKVEFSQTTTDAIGIISAITLAITIFLIIGALIYAYIKVEKPIKELQKEKLKLEIKNLEQRLKNNTTKEEFMQTEIEIMKKKVQK